MLYRADLLRAAKGAKNMTLDEIAERAGIKTRQTVSRVLDGDPRVGYDTFVKVANALGFTDVSKLTVSLSGPTDVNTLADVLPAEKIA